MTSCLRGCCVTFVIGPASGVDRAGTALSTPLGLKPALVRLATFGFRACSAYRPITSQLVGD